MKNLIFKTNDNLASTVLRITLGLVIFLHGIGKLGGGFGTFLDYLTGYLNLPAILAYLTVLIETLGSLLLIFGVATRINAGIMFGLFIGMIVTVHAQFGFMMNWFGRMQAGQEGYEYHLLVLAMCGALVALGGGRFSVDKMIVK